MPTTNNPATSMKSFPKQTPAADADKSPADLIDARIGELVGWRGDLLSREGPDPGADASITEAWKWNTPVWSCGDPRVGETYKKVVKLTFPKGASLPDPSKLFNSSLEGNARRAIDFPEDGHVDEASLVALVRAAIALNGVWRRPRACCLGLRDTHHRYAGGLLRPRAARGATGRPRGSINDLVAICRGSGAWRHGDEPHRATKSNRVAC